MNLSNMCIHTAYQQPWSHLPPAILLCGVSRQRLPRTRAARAPLLARLSCLAAALVHPKDHKCPTKSVLGSLAAATPTFQTQGVLTNTKQTSKFAMQDDAAAMKTLCPSPRSRMLQTSSHGPQERESMHQQFMLCREPHLSWSNRGSAEASTGDFSGACVGGMLLLG